MDNDLVEKVMSANSKLAYQNECLRKALQGIINFIDNPEDGVGSAVWNQRLDRAREALKLKN